MRTAQIDKNRRCPRRGKIEHQIRVGFNASGTQRCKCKDCNIHYTVEPRQHEYPEVVDNEPEAKRYCTDGYSGYLDVVFPGEHTRNIHDKSDTFTVKGVNADLRHYIPVLARGTGVSVAV